MSKQYLSLPPYLSTSWDQVRSLHMDAGTLVVTLCDGQRVEVPSLSAELLESVFHEHASHLSSDTPSTPRASKPSEPKASPPEFGPTGNSALLSGFKLGFGSLDGLSGAMQHNPELADSADLPTEMLQKIAAVARIMAPADIAMMPKGEPHCNCIYCQIARAIHDGVLEEEEAVVQVEDTEPQVADEELTFREWDIVKEDDQRYTVTNPLIPAERYSVFLGDPIGCTCGQSNCEHLLAVLRS